MNAEVRPATADDRGAVIGSVAAAFSGDPAWDFILGAGNAAGAQAFAAALFDARVERGTVWLADDGAAVAMWDRTSPERSGGVVDPWPRFRDEVGEQVWARLWALRRRREGLGSAAALLVPRGPGDASGPSG